MRGRSLCTLVLAQRYWSMRILGARWGVCRAWLNGTTGPVLQDGRLYSCFLLAPSHVILLPCMVEWTGSSVHTHLSPGLSPQQLVKCAGDIFEFAVFSGHARSPFGLR